MTQSPVSRRIRIRVGICVILNYSALNSHVPYKHRMPVCLCATGTLQIYTFFFSGPLLYMLFRHEHDVLRKFSYDYGKKKEMVARFVITTKGKRHSVVNFVW